MAKKWIVVDLDGTVLRNDLRKYLSVAEMKPELSYEEINETYGIDHLLSKEQKEGFMNVFLSEKYLHLDEPVEGAAECLWRMKSKFNIAYVTGRQDEPGNSMRDGTEKWIIDNGFPVPNGIDVTLTMKPSRSANDKEYKLGAVRAIGDAVAGIGDITTDHEVYEENGLKSIILYTNRLKDMLREKKTPVVKDWQEIEAILEGI